MSKLRTHLTYANVTATLALFLVVAGGSAYAAKKIKLKNNSVSTAKIRDAAVTSPKVAVGAVTGDKIANGAIKGAALGPITTVSSTSGTITPGTEGSVFVQCPAGSVVLSGGGAPNGSQIYAELNRKSDPQGWRYDAFNESAGNRTITVFAYCLG